LIEVVLAFSNDLLNVVMSSKHAELFI